MKSVQKRFIAFVSAIKGASISAELGSTSRHTAVKAHGNENERIVSTQCRSFFFLLREFIHLSLLTLVSEQNFARQRDVKTEKSASVETDDRDK